MSGSDLSTTKRPSLGFLIAGQVRGQIEIPRISGLANWDVTVSLSTWRDSSAPGLAPINDSKLGRVFGEDAWAVPSALTPYLDNTIGNRPVAENVQARVDALAEECSNSGYTLHVDLEDSHQLNLQMSQSRENSLRMLYKWWRGLRNLPEAAANLDVVVCCRPDLITRTAVHIETIMESLQDHDVLIDTNRTTHTGYANDIFWIATGRKASAVVALLTTASRTDRSWRGIHFELFDHLSEIGPIGTLKSFLGVRHGSALVDLRDYLRETQSTDVVPSSVREHCESALQLLAAPDMPSITADQILDATLRSTSFVALQGISTIRLAAHALRGTNLGLSQRLALLSWLVAPSHGGGVLETLAASQVQADAIELLQVAANWLKNGSEVPPWEADPTEFLLDTLVGELGFEAVFRNQQPLRGPRAGQLTDLCLASIGREAAILCARTGVETLGGEGRAPVAAWVKLAQLLFESGDASGAVVAAQAATSSDPSSAWAWERLSWMLDKTGDLEGAAEAARMSVDAEPAWPYGHLRLSSALSGQGDPDGAILSARAATQVAALDDVAVWVHLSQLLLSAGDVEGALEAAYTATARVPDSAWAWERLSDVLERSGEHTAALTAAQRASRLAPDWHWIKPLGESDG